MSDNLGSLTVANGRADHAEMMLAGARDAQRRLTGQLADCEGSNLRLVEKIECLDSELYQAVQTAYNRGAVDWVRLNYPKYYDQFKHTPPVYADSPASSNAKLDMALSLLREGPQTEKVQAFLASLKSGNE